MGKVINWTDEMVEDLKKYIGQGLSGGQIAAKLTLKFNEHYSRNSIIGKAHRIGILLGKKVGANKISNKLKISDVKKKSKNVIEDIKPKKDLKLSTITILAEPVKNKTQIFPNPKALGVTLMDLSEGMCKYPLGDVKNDDIRFCGAIADSKHRSYCSHCYPIVYMTIRKYREMTAKNPQQPSKDN